MGSKTLVRAKGMNHVSNYWKPTNFPWKNRLALAALSTHASTAILQKPSALLHDTHVFSDQIELEGTPVTNQRSSGRCWLFASTNVFRVPIIKKYKLTGFELSQNYLFFWDKLEKANFFLERMRRFLSSRGLGLNPPGDARD